MRVWPVVLLFLGGCAAGPTTPVPPEVAMKIEAANRKLEDLFRRGDRRGVAHVYAEDALLLSPSGRRVSGRPAIVEYWERFEPGDDPDWILEIHDIEGDGSLVKQRGRSTLSYESRDGGPTTSVVEFLLIWIENETGEYEIVVDAYW